MTPTLRDCCWIRLECARCGPLGGAIVKDSLLPRGCPLCDHQPLLAAVISGEGATSRELPWFDVAPGYGLIPFREAAKKRRSGSFHMSLTAKQKSEIRAKYPKVNLRRQGTGVSLKSLAREYGVGLNTVRRALGEQT